MPLESRNDTLECIPLGRRRIEAIAISRQARTQAGDRTGLGQGVARRHGLDPMADARLRQQPPGKLLARIDLAPGGDIGMGQHVRRADRVAGKDVAAQFDDPVDLGLGELDIAELVAGIVDLDADGDAS